MWVRFEHEREPYGLFSYLSEARSQLTGEALLEVETLRHWFRSQLDAPELSTRADERFWFREEADQHIARARRLAELCRLAGIPIVERRTARIPGKVRWEDPRQVAVLTYRDAPRAKRDD